MKYCFANEIKTPGFYFGFNYVGENIKSGMPKKYQGDIYANHLFYIDGDKVYKMPLSILNKMMGSSLTGATYYRYIFFGPIELPEVPEKMKDRFDDEDLVKDIIE